MKRHFISEPLISLIMKIIRIYKESRLPLLKNKEKRTAERTKLENMEGVGITLGSQISQVMALVAPNKIDHTIKDVKGIECFERYMDDGIIEVASDTSEPYAVTSAAYSALIKLVADICKRNGIKKLVWSTNKADRVNHKNGCNMTVHRDYANKSCPGTYLYNKHGEIAAEVNKLLGATETKTDTTVSASIKAGDIVSIKSDATYYSGKTIPTWVKNKKWIVKSVSGDRAVIDKSQDGKNAICSPVNVKYLTVEKSTTATETFKSYRVKITTSVLNIRKGPGTNYGTNGAIKDMGVYTIVAESAGTGATKWGKLKSGAGWISLDYAKKL